MIIHAQLHSGFICKVIKSKLNQLHVFRSYLLTFLRDVSLYILLQWVHCDTFSSFPPPKKKTVKLCIENWRNIWPRVPYDESKKPFETIDRLPLYMFIYLFISIQLISIAALCPRTNARLCLCLCFFADVYLETHSCSSKRLEFLLCFVGCSSSSFFSPWSRWGTLVPKTALCISLAPLNHQL